MRTLVGLALALGLQGCSQGHGSEKLSGAMKRDIPVYEPSRVEDREESAYEAGATLDNLQYYHAYRWTLRSSDPPEKIVAFYRDLALPPEEDDERSQGNLDDELEEGSEEGPTEAFFQLPPGDSDSVTVTVHLRPAKKGGTRFLIRESVLAGRRG